MRLIHNIVDKLPDTDDPHILSNYNTREEVLACNEPLGIDGVYKNVWENRDVLEGKDVILFVTGDYIGGDNSFDIGMPHEEFCTIKQLQDLVEMGCKLGWHTWSHRDLTALVDEDEIIEELTPPSWIEPKYFAFPYGRFNSQLVEILEDLGYEKAWSVTQGTDYRLTLKREYL